MKRRQKAWLRVEEVLQLMWGSLGASLSSMVANLGANKRGWEDRIEEFSNWAVKAQAIKDKLLFYVDEDTRSFNGIIDAIRMPKDTEEEKSH